MPDQLPKTNTPMTLTTSEFWQASLAIYQRPGMQARLLAAQDNHGRNINLELLQILLSDDGEAFGAQTPPLSDSEYQQLYTRVMAFSQSHTQKVRALRRELSQSVALDQKSREQLKAQLLAAELSLEKQEQAILIDALRELRTAR